MNGVPHAAAPGPVAQLLVIVAGAALVGYLVAATRPGPRRWSRWRTASFGTGTALLVLALLVPGHGFVDHMWRHLLVGMLAPLGLVLGAPGTLLLRTLDRRAGRATARLLRSRPARVLNHPVSALLLSVGGLWLLYLTPLYRASVANPALHDLVNLHVLLAGVLFTWSIAGPDPAPHRPSVPTRLVVVGVAVAAHAALAQLMYANLWVDIPATPSALRAGASVMYYGGDLAELLLALALLGSWRPVRRTGTRRPLRQRLPRWPTQRLVPGWPRSVSPATRTVHNSADRSIDMSVRTQEARAYRT